MSIYQVKWFSKKKGYGFVQGSDSKEYFVHHSDIKVDSGFRYLKQGEYVQGEPESMDGEKVKLAQISPPMVNGNLMCEIESQSGHNHANDSEP